MALMPEDLEDKRFTPVRFSEGYDMDEVDDYLDNEVLPRLKELIDENARLTMELEEAHQRIAELEAGAQPSVGGSAPFVASDHDEVVVEDHDRSEHVVADQAPAYDASVDTSTQAAPVAAPVAETPDQAAAGIIALANRLHDEYVKNGEDERDRLIAEANEEHRRIVGEAEEKSRTTLEALEAEKAELERTIEGLRTFERDYRNRLRNYLEGQLRELDTDETQDKQANFGL
ncbi:DivIVA domain-containing protein [Brachybacterium sp. EF45031]|uniref:DivIVA domain-containing protein n=1 Tax=Brachybacterium sillae TaxID=2810536 RepID=UPI00217E0E3F|nr:DivIVA domain-containing protein [Brachybacterium sillae]MCS6712410.1 DivIVA domain-containing protein [Brachybacterium sillae]